MMISGHSPASFEKDRKKRWLFSLFCSHSICFSVQKMGNEVFKETRRLAMMGFTVCFLRVTLAHVGLVTRANFVEILGFQFG